jgi:O-methyltransferase
MSNVVSGTEKISWAKRATRGIRRRLVRWSVSLLERLLKHTETAHQLQRVTRALHDAGGFELASPTKLGDPTTQGAMAYSSREHSIFVYRSAFKQAIQYLAGTQIKGPVAEFGTHSGFTARCIAELLALHKIETPLYLFDSFEGLPDIAGSLDENSYETKVNKVWLSGTMSVPLDFPELIRKSVLEFVSEENLHIIKGYFDQTLSAHLPRAPLSLIHVDCDLYLSAKYVLNMLAERELFQDGCIVMFDDYNCNRANPNMGERLALAELLAQQDRWTCSPWFAYGWHGQAFFVHDKAASAAHGQNLAKSA